MYADAKAAYGGLVFGVFAISWSAILVRWAAVPGPVSAFWRVALACGILLGWSAIRKTAILNWKQLGWAACGGFFFAADLALFNTAATQGGAANVTVLGNNTPIFAGLLSWALWGRKPSVGLWLGLACALIGTTILAGGDALKYAHFGQADFMAVSASLCFAIYLLATERVRSESGTLSFLTAALGSTAIFLLLFNVIAGFSLAVPNPQSWAALTGLALVPQLTGYLAITYALGHLPATTVSLGLMGQIPLTAVLALVLLKETLLPHELLGGALILLAIWLTLRHERR